MAKTIITILIAFLVIGGVSYGFYQYTKQPVIAPVVNQNTTNANTTKVNVTAKIFLVALEDNGKSGQAVGCGDSLVAVDYPVTSTESNSVTKIKTALEALLGEKDQYYGQSGLYNALYQSELAIDSVVIGGTEATIGLTGNVTVSGTCDNPRVKAQLEQTILEQASSLTTVNIYINDKPIDEVLSGQGA